MSAIRWQPLGFLLPAWPELQTTILHRSSASGSRRRQHASAQWSRNYESDATQSRRVPHKKAFDILDEGFKLPPRDEHGSLVRKPNYTVKDSTASGGPPQSLTPAQRVLKWRQQIHSRRRQEDWVSGGGYKGQLGVPAVRKKLRPSQRRGPGKKRWDYISLKPEALNQHERDAPFRASNGRAWAALRRHPEQRQEKQEQSDTKLSLMEEFFPELAKTQDTAEGGSMVETRKLAPVDLSWRNEDLDVDNPGWGSPADLKSQSVVSRTSWTDETTKIGEEHAIIVRSYDTTLDEDDFRRILPRGKHIEEWRGWGSFSRIIAGRDRRTLARRGFYVLTFRDQEFAVAFKERAKIIHTAATSGMDYDSMPLGFLESPKQRDRLSTTEKADPGMLRNEYSLATKGQSFPVTHVYPPLTNALKYIISRRGLEQIKGREKRLVHFHVDGYQPTAVEIRRMLTENGRARNAPWSATNSIEQYEGRGSDQPEDDTVGPLEQELSADPYYTKRRSSGAESKPWLLTFADEAEARRFIRLWHMRPWPLATGTRAGGEQRRGGLATIHTKLIW